MDAGGNPVIGGVGPFPARGRQNDLCAAPDHQASALLQEREDPARLATDGATPLLSVAWPQKAVKTSYVESRGNSPDGWQVGLVVPQDSVDDVHQLVGDSPDGGEVVLPSASPFFVERLQGRVIASGYLRAQPPILLHLGRISLQHLAPFIHHAPFLQVAFANAPQMRWRQDPNLRDVPSDHRCRHEIQIGTNN